MQPVYVSSATPSRIGVVNRSSWLITVGTHKKPYNNTELLLLDTSLRAVMDRVLSRPDFANQFLMPVRQINGKHVAMEGDNWRTDDELQIMSQKATYTVEVGTKQGRIDAHVIYEVKHRTRLQFDHRRFGAVVDEELEEENLAWERDGVMSRRDSQPLRWAAPSVYTSFRLLGKINQVDALAYLQKQNDAGAVRAAAEGLLSLSQVS